MKVPQFIPWVGEDEYRAIKACFDNNWITEGPQSKAFMDEILKVTGAKYGVLAPNGTLALYLALKSLGICPGDEVLVPDFTFVASANAVVMAGARPVFVDVLKNTLQVDLSNAESAMTGKTKAIMPVHIFGSMGDMDELQKFAGKYNLKIIEDAAQAIGVHFRNKHAGTFGDTGVFSFFADKSITCAEGGCVVTNSRQTYEKLRLLRNQGRLDRGTFIHSSLGYNFRLTDIQSIIGLVQLKKLGKIIEKKNRIKSLYKKLLFEVQEVRLIQHHPDSEWVPFRVGIVCERAQELMSIMREKDIEPRTFFYPLHKQPCYTYLKKDAGRKALYDDSNFPNSVYAYEHGICLPTFPTITDEQIEYVCSVIKVFYG